MLGLLGILWSAPGAASAVDACLDKSPQNDSKTISGDAVLSDWERLQEDLRAAQSGTDGHAARELKWVDLDLRWRIAENGGIPKWDGTQLLDASDIVCGTVQVDDEARKMLAKLNYWEQAYGLSSIPPELKDRMVVGEERAAMECYVADLEKKGIRVVLDLDAGLWKVAGEDSH